MSADVKPKTSGPLAPGLESGLVLQIARKNPEFSSTCVAEEYRKRSGRNIPLQRVIKALDSAGESRPVTRTAGSGLMPGATPETSREVSEPVFDSKRLESVPADEPPVGGPAGPAAAEKPPGFQPGDVVTHAPGVPFVATSPGWGPDDHDRELDAMRAVKDALKGLPKPAARRAVEWATRVLEV